MPTPCLVAVVVTFNRLEQLKTTLSQLLREGPSLAGCIVLDNGSTDGTADWLSTQQDPRLVVQWSRENLGGSGGFAAVMKAAKTLFDPDWIVLMDDDARPLSGTFHTFMSKNRSSADAWAARVTYPDGTLCDMNRPWVNPFSSPLAFARTLIKGRDGFHITEKSHQISAIDGTSFVGLFLSRHVIDRIGYPDPDLFIYGDDVLYTLAMTRAGLALKYDPLLAFEHDCETFTAKATMSPLWKVYYYHRNQVFVYRAAAGPVLFWPLLALRAVLWRLRANRYGVDKSQYLHLLNLALRDGIARRKPHKPDLTTRTSPNTRLVQKPRKTA
jgi:GT2 family glycosyltransferase